MSIHWSCMIHVLSSVALLRKAFHLSRQVTICQTYVRKLQEEIKEAVNHTPVSICYQQQYNTTTLVFQDNVAKLEPERQTILDCESKR